ncbi:hypothetical protein BHE74_00054556 [Ensete ventricosum]|nr:hypothetical protein BHE74_00054556 [Ensete ventricosum]
MDNSGACLGSCTKGLVGVGAPDIASLTTKSGITAGIRSATHEKEYRRHVDATRAESRTSTDTLPTAQDHRGHALVRSRFVLRAEWPLRDPSYSRRDADRRCGPHRHPEAPRVTPFTPDFLSPLEENYARHASGEAADASRPRKCVFTRPGGTAVASTYLDARPPSDGVMSRKAEAAPKGVSRLLPATYAVRKPKPFRAPRGRLGKYVGWRPLLYDYRVGERVGAASARTERTIKMRPCSAPREARRGETVKALVD